MTSLVVYDSVFGNTEKIAQTIADTLHTKAVRIDEISLDLLRDLSILIVGSPTRAFTASKIILKFIKSLKNVNHHIEKVAIFDTRIDVDKQDNNLLGFMVKKFGYANDAMTKQFVKLGFKKIESTYYYVEGTEGPLAQDAVEKAKSWASEISA